MIGSFYNFFGDIMNKPKLLARREYFGYLFYEPIDGDLFVLNSKSEIDFSENINNQEECRYDT